MSDATLGAIVFFGGLLGAALSGARARRQAALLGMGAESSEAEAVEVLYIGMFLLMSLSGVLYGLGIIGTGEEDVVVVDDVDTAVEPSLTDRLRTWVAETSPEAPSVPLSHAPRATSVPLDRFRVFSGEDCRAHWAVLTLTPGRTWVGSERLPPARRRMGVDPELYDAMLDIAETWKVAAERPCPDAPATPFEGELLVRVDPAVPPEELRLALFTAAQAQFGDFLVQVQSDTLVPLPEGDPEALPTPWWDADVSSFLRIVALHGNGEVSTRDQGEDGPWPDMEPLDDPSGGELPAEPARAAVVDPVSVVRLRLPTIGPGSRPAPPARPVGFSLSEGIALGTVSRREMKQQLLSMADEFGACAARPSWTGVVKYTVDKHGAFTSAQFKSSDLPEDEQACQLALVEGLRVSPPVGGGMSIVTVRMTEHGP